MSISEGSSFTIAKLKAGSPELRLAAKWRYDAFLEDEGYTVEDSAEQLRKLAASPAGCETALIASIGGRPVGVCLLVLHELPPAHDFSPWLASLFVLPQHRGRGIARALIAAIEYHARSFGVMRLHLYTGEAEGLYAKCGWRVAERMSSGFVLMMRDLL